MNQCVYIIMPYYRNMPPLQGQKILYVYKLHDNWYCICQCELEWGHPKVAIPIEEESDFYSYNFFKTYDEAFEYVKLIKELNR